tara:strand:- start:27 stop:1055 length:1029 start_codon:yes stop_codon:yes gene_type:complete
MPKTKQERIRDYMKLSKEKKKRARDDIKNTNQLTGMLSNLKFKTNINKLGFKNNQKRSTSIEVDVNKISKLFQNFTTFGSKKVKNLSKFQKELIEISKEKDDKKYLRMVIELLIGSGLLITAIVLLLIFLHNPRNDQNTFDNTGNNNNTRPSLAEEAQNYRDNRLKLNERIKPTDYEEKKGKNFFYNTVTRKFNIPSDKYAIIVKNFKQKNDTDIVDIKTIEQYKSLESITKAVMNDNTEVTKNLGKRKILSRNKESIDKRSIKGITEEISKILLPKTPTRRKKVTSTKGRKKVTSTKGRKDTSIKNNSPIKITEVDKRYFPGSTLTGGKKLLQLREGKILR